MRLPFFYPDIKLMIFIHKLYGHGITKGQNASHSFSLHFDLISYDFVSYDPCVGK